MSTLDAVTIQSQADETPPVFKDAEGSREIVQGAWAWVHFDGGGTVAIQESFNVSSITDNGTGDYSVNFATALPTSTYACLMSTGDSSGQRQVSRLTGTYSASVMRMYTHYVIDGALQDATYVGMAAFCNP